jgi:hypothetical protein
VPTHPCRGAAHAIMRPFMLHGWPLDGMKDFARLAPPPPPLSVNPGTAAGFTPVCDRPAGFFVFAANCARFAACNLAPLSRNEPDLGAATYGGACTLQRRLHGKWFECPLKSVTDG